MDTGIIKEYLKDVGSNGKIIIAVVLIIAFAFYPDIFLKLFEKTNSNPPPAQINNYSADGNQVIAPVTANDQATINQHIGDTHHHGLSVEDAMKLAEKLAAEKGEKDAQVIKSLQETIQALAQQNTEKYDIQQAFDLLAQGNTAKAEEVFASIADEAKRKGKEANIKEAEALRHLGSLVFLHDTKKAFAAYQRSTELDPENWDGWNNLGHLYHRIGELENAGNAYMAVQKLSLLQLNREGEAAAYGNLGNVYKTQGDLKRSVEFHEKALTIDKELGNKEGMASQYGNLGNVYRIQGDLRRAIEFHEKALAIDKELGRKEGMAANYGNLGNVYRIQGDLKRAIEYWKQSLALFQQLGAKDEIAMVQSWIDEVEQKDSN